MDKITLAGKEITVSALSIRQSQEWRKRAKPILETQVEIASESKRINDNEGSDADYAELYKGYAETLDEFIEEIVSLVLMYVPESDHDCILDRCTEEEAMAAFITLVGKSFNSTFFLTIQSGILLAGSESSPIGTNSASRNGDVGVMS